MVVLTVAVGGLEAEATVITVRGKVWQSLADWLFFYSLLFFGCW